MSIIQKLDKYKKRRIRGEVPSKIRKLNSLRAQVGRFRKMFGLLLFITTITTIYRQVLKQQQ